MDAKYWKLRANLTQADLLVEQAQRLMDRASSIRSIAMKEAELDPTKNYKMDDNKESIEELTK